MTESIALEVHRPPPRVVIAGGSGFLGTSLAAFLAERGWAVTVLSRHAPASRPGVHHVAWDGRTLGAWGEALGGAAAIINLAGRNVDCRKTPEHRDEILRSRVESTRVLGVACRAIEARGGSVPPVWIQMSTAHIYGDPPQARCDETSIAGLGFAPDIGRAWESEFHSAKDPSQRGVILRTSFVIGRRNPGGSGAMGRLRPLARLGLGGAVGHGRQGMSWIHERDVHRIVLRVLDDPTMSGVYVVSAPEPRSQREFMRELRKHSGGLGRLIGLPATEWMVRIAAPLLLRTDPELALYGRYVLPRRLIDEGFTFEFPSLRDALMDLAR